MLPVESFLSIPALGLLTRMRAIAEGANPRGYLRVGRKDIRPEDLLWYGDRTHLPPILTELMDVGLIQIRDSLGRRFVVLPELLEEEIQEPPSQAAPTVLRKDGYREWTEAYQPTHETNCPRYWDAALAAGWTGERIVAIARWYSLECHRKNEKRMRSSLFFQRLHALEKQYLEATKEERDGKAVWQQEALTLFAKPEGGKVTKAA